MTDEYILAFDLGTTGNKATLFSMSGEAVASVFKGYETLYPQPGWAEQRAADWWDSVVGAARALRAASGVRANQIAAIGLSGHMMGCLPVDGRGVPLADSVIHADSRSVLECEALDRSIGGPTVYQITGQRLDPHYPLPKAMWLRGNAPGLLPKARFLIQCKDYVAFRFTGNLGVTDFSDASLTGLYDINAMGWSEELAEAAGICPRLFPEVLPSNAIAGQVSAEASRQTGLREGTPVVAGAGDGACATLGAGVVTPGSAYNYVGGTSWIAALVDRPILDPEMRLFTLGSVEPGRYCTVGTVQSAGSSVEWLAETVCRDEKQRAAEEGASQFDVMDRQARQSVPGAHRLFFLPYLMGERAPIWDPAARGVFLGLTLGHTRADLIRAVLEGVAYALKSILDVMSEQGIGTGKLRMIGGGAKSGLWLEILASVFGRTLRTARHPGQSTSLGAALIAGVAVKAFSDYHEAARRVRFAGETAPNDAWSREYRIFHPYYASLYPVLKDSYRRLAELSAETAGSRIRA